VILLVVCSCYKEEPVSVEMLKNKALGGDKKAVKKLIELFGSNDVNIQNDSYKAVVDVKDGAVDVLLDELDGAKGDKWEYIVASLGMIKNKKAVDKLIVELKSDKKRRYAAAFALGQIRDKKAIRALVDALDDNDMEVKKYAALSISKYTQKDEPSAEDINILDELISFLNKDDVSDKNFALSAIGEIKDARAFDAVLKEVDGKFKAQAIWALGKLKDERAVDSIIKELKHPDWEIRVAAARSLGSIHSDKAITALENNLEDKNVFAREWAARALEDITRKDYKYKNEKGEMIIPTSLYR
jgi:HEAT repeat protein